MAISDKAIVPSKGPPKGRIVDWNGSPVAGVNVSLYHRVSYWGLGNHVVEKVTTDADGRFVFSHPLAFKVSRGTDRHDHYFLIATRNGFAPAWKIIVGGTLDEESFSLVLTKAISASFSVVDMNMQPVEGATIYLTYAAAQLDRASFFSEAYQLSEDSGICHGMTDTNGRVTLENLPDTEYQVAATKLGYEVRFGENLIKDAIPTFILRPEGVLEGHVRDSLGNAVEGATVWIYPTWRFHVYFMAKTDKLGRYRIDKIWCEGRTEGSGKYTVGIRDSRFTATTREVAFARGQVISNFDIEAVPGTQVIGTLLDHVTRAPVSGAEVYLDSSSGRQTCLTGLEGDFKCRVMTGEVRIFFGLPPGGSFVADERTRRDDPSTIRAHAEGAALAVTLHTPGGVGKLGTLRGKAVDTYGRPAAFCAISIALTEEHRGRIRTSGWTGNIFRGAYADANGEFSLTLPVGMEFTLVADDLAGRRSGMTTGNLIVDPTELLEPITLHPTRNASVVLVSLLGEPRPNLEVEVTPRAKGVDLWLNRQEDITDAEGRLYLENIAKGLTYRIAAKGSHYDWGIFDPASGQDSDSPISLLVSDRLILRVEDSGQYVLIKKLISYFVWMRHGEEWVRWTNTLPEKLEKVGANVAFSRENLGNRAGNKIDMVVETEDRKRLTVSGMIPEEGSGLLEVSTKTPSGPPK